MWTMWIILLTADDRFHTFYDELITKGVIHRFIHIALCKVNNSEENGEVSFGERRFMIYLYLAEYVYRLHRRFFA